jgi:hypothetical protein
MRPAGEGRPHYTSSAIPSEPVERWLGFRFKSVGFRVLGWRVRVQGLGLRDRGWLVQGAGLRNEDQGLRLDIDGRWLRDEG